jgi:hypothetical protein
MLRCSIYVMSSGTGRDRSLPKGVVELMQGANSRDGQTIYPGDREIHEPVALTVQIHTLNVLETPRGPLLETDVPALAFWVPVALASDFLVAG